MLEILEQADFTPNKFVYRWVNNVFSREFDVSQLIMIWDKLIAEEQEIATYLTYVCAALLLSISKDIKKFENCSEEIIMYIQDLPTNKWTMDDIKVLMAESYQLQTLFQNNTHLDKLGN